MHARETEHDHTTASGQRIFDLYAAPAGWRIDGVAGVMAASVSFKDGGHSDSTFNLGSGGPVSRMVFVGDTNGKEAGTRTKVDVTFNQLQIKETQVADCVPAGAVQELRRHNLISDGVFQRLAPEIERVRRINPYP